MCEEELKQIQDLLKHEHIDKRKTGVALARQMLADGQCREAVRAILKEVAQNDMISIVSAPAKEALAEDDARYATHPPRYESSDKKHIVGAVCPNLHPNYYDKRVICRGDDRERVRSYGGAGKPVDEIEVMCNTKTCGAKFKIKVSCEGYK